MRFAAAVFAIGVLSACSSSSSLSSVSHSPSPSAHPTATAGPDCAGVSTARALALYAYNPVLDVLDVTDPVQPKLVCFIPNASAGRFLSATTVALWNASTAEVMDITTSKVLRSQKLSGPPYEGTFTADAAVFAYRVATSDGIETMHLLDMTSGSDRLLYTQAPMGGHGGMPGGPTYQLLFSPDGKELLDFDIFRPQGGPATLQVFRLDGSKLFEAYNATAGIWAPTASTLYLVTHGVNMAEELDSVGSDGTLSVLMGGLTAVNWPVLSPDGRALVFDTYDATAPGEATGGLPHLWRLDIATLHAMSIGGGVSSQPVFVGAHVVWSNQEKPCECGPGGASQVDGVVLAHDLGTGTDVMVNMDPVVPGIGGPTVMPNTGYVVDVLLRTP
jgi:hypothetical protein